MKSLVSMVAGLVVFGGLVSGEAVAGDTCVYVLGEVEGRSVSTPGIMVVWPDQELTVDMTRVVVDPTTQTILGYTLEAPGLDFSEAPKSVFLPGGSQSIPSYSVFLQDLELSHATCISMGVVTPAVPIYVPASALQVPGFLADTPGITFNVGGRKVTVPGRFFEWAGETVVIPSNTFTLPSLSLGTPDSSITVNIRGSLKSARYLKP